MCEFRFPKNDQKSGNKADPDRNSQRRQKGLGTKATKQSPVFSHGRVHASVKRASGYQRNDSRDKEYRGGRFSDARQDFGIQLPRSGSKKGREQNPAREQVKHKKIYAPDQNSAERGKKKVFLSDSEKEGKSQRSEKGIE